MPEELATINVPSEGGLNADKTLATRKRRGCSKGQALSAPYPVRKEEEEVESWTPEILIKTDKQGGSSGSKKKQETANRRG